MGGPIELFLIPASAPRLVVAYVTKAVVVAYVTKVMGVAYVAAAGFLSHYQNGP